MPGIYTKENLEYYLNYINKRLASKLFKDEYTFYNKARIVTEKQLELVAKGWTSDDIAKASYLHTSQWLKTA